MENLSKQLLELDKNIILVYAFNGTGKTRLSVSYKDLTKANNGATHSGVYYNAYSEDLFIWDNDHSNDGANVRLLIQRSTLNQYHALLDEANLREKLAPYKPKFDFRFTSYNNPEDGIEYIQFILSANDPTPIKISRGEQQIFVFCFFLALFDIEGWTGDGNQSSHFFIDDPVSSLDDHNIFVTATSVMNLIERHYKNRKIIITTHHVYFFSIIADWLGKGEKASAYKDHVQRYILKHKKGGVRLVSPSNDVFLYHLELLQTLKKAINSNKLFAYHFALLRQILENLSSFHGYGHFSFVLKHIGLTDDGELAQLLNIMAHKNVFLYEGRELVPDNEARIRTIFSLIQQTYNFKLHA
ncbi:MAG: anticodon nuclease [Cytophagales bacterium]|nr:MAG: anticodon nuclease [Cytophagales bacterium]